MLDEGYDFSFSGVKSAVLNYINKCNMTGVEYVKEDIAASFQKAVTEVLVKKTADACRRSGMKKVAVAGGVSANKYLREKLSEECGKNGFEFNVPDIVLCTDNAAMIGSAAFYEYENGNTADMSVNAYPNLRLGEK